MRLVYIARAKIKGTAILYIQGRRATEIYSAVIYNLQETSIFYFYSCFVQCSTIDDEFAAISHDDTVYVAHRNGSGNI